MLIAVGRIHLHIVITIPCRTIWRYQAWIIFGVHVQVCVRQGQPLLADAWLDYLRGLDVHPSILCALYHPIRSVRHIANLIERPAEHTHGVHLHLCLWRLSRSYFLERMCGDIPSPHQLLLLRYYNMHAMGVSNCHCGNNAASTVKHWLGNIRNIWRILCSCVAMDCVLRSRNARSRRW